MYQSGSQRWAVMTSSVIEYGEQAAVMSILFDITEHKRSEGKLRYDRMRDAVRRMGLYLSRRHGAGGRGPPGYFAALQEFSDDEQGYPESSARIRSTVEHVEMLLRSTKEFCREHVPKRAVQDMGQAVAERKAVLAALLTGKYELVMARSLETLNVMMDSSRMESALMNLVLHSREQMPRGGIVTIAVARAHIDASFIRRTGYGRVGMYAAISVTDSAETMPDNEQEKLFEPFFMTKGVWQGNGLGLSTVYEIAKEHDGYITVAGRPGQGMSYSMYFPLVPV